MKMVNKEHSLPPKFTVYYMYDGDIGSGWYYNNSVGKKFGPHYTEREAIDECNRNMHRDGYPC